MKAIYFQDPKGNFGDELNRWMWPKIFGDAITGFGHHSQETHDENNAQDLLFYGIGTILDGRIPQQPEKIIFGSGFGYGEKPLNVDGCNIFFVRGQETAKLLGIPPEKALTDPAILLRRYFSPVPDSEKLHDISFMPHHSSIRGDFWRKTCKELNINYIDPTGFDVEMVIKEIASSRLVIAEAMHAAIVADTFRVPWIAVSSVKETNNFKWRDWCSTLNLTYAPIRLTPIFSNAGNKLWKEWLNNLKQHVRKRQLMSVIKSRSKALLSDDQLLDSHMEAMNLQVRALEDYLQKRAKT